MVISKNFIRRATYETPEEIMYYDDSVIKEIIEHLQYQRKIADDAIMHLVERENKLKMIEQMFKSGTVDLKELKKIVEGK